MAQRPVFVSAVSSELTTARRELTDDLKTQGHTIIVHESLKLLVEGATTLLDVLNSHLSTCEAAICLIGRRAGGGFPSASEEAPYARHRPPTMPRASYTQWEFLLAQAHGRPVLACHPTPAFPTDKTDDALDEPDDTALQAAFLAYVEQTGVPRIAFKDRNELGRLVLRQLPGRTGGGTPIHLPYPSLGPLFKGRDAFLSAIHDSLTQGTGTAITAAIHGLGGVGKTRAAVEYAWAHHPTLSAALLIPARTPAGLTTALAELTAPLGLPTDQSDAQREAAVLAWLNDHPGWLLILDNADSPEAMQAATALMGRLHGGHVLLTTRLTTLPGAFRRLPLDVLPPEAAADLLLEASVGRRPAPDDRVQALLLAEALGGLALALTHAAAYVAARGLSLERYRGLLATAFDRLIGYSAPTVTQYERSTAATLALSVAQLTDAGRALLERLAFLAHAPVPDFLMDVPVPDLGEEDLTEALADLAAYSLVTRDLEAGTFTVHRLVREITRRALSPDAERARLTQALGWVNAAFTGDPQDVRDWLRLDPLAEHAEAVALAARAAGIADPTARLMGDLGVLFHVKARYDRAESMMDGALALTEASRGKDHPDLAVDLNNLAQLLEATNRLGEAEPLMRRALAIDEASYGAEHPLVAIRLNNLGSLMYATDRLGEAEPLVRRMVVIFLKFQRATGHPHPHREAVLANHAHLLRAMGRDEAFIAAEQQAMHREAGLA